MTRRKGKLGVGPGLWTYRGKTLARLAVQLTGSYLTVDCSKYMSDIISVDINASTSNVHTPMKDHGSAKNT